MILEVPKVSYISNVEDIHNKRFVSAISSRFSIDQFYLQNSAFIDTNYIAKNSNIVVFTPLTLNTDLIDGISNLPLIGICMAYEINEESKDPILREQLIENISKCSAVVCDSLYIENILRNEFKFKQEIVKFAYGCDQELFLPIKFKDSQKLRIISTRNWTKIHANQVLVNALYKLNGEGIDFEANLYGTESALDEFLISQISNVNQPRISIRGEYINDELPALFGNHEIYISTSLSDGTSVSLLEALSAGRICVCRDFPTNREWIEDGINGFLFNDTDQLIKILMRLKDLDFPHKKNISVAARNSVLGIGNWQIQKTKLLDLIARYSN